ncbi:MAG: ribosome maturation factor RimP [Cytophagales bacterium]|nr:ribosome maturation factor RimP [Cytophaga sp.]
MVNQEQVIKGFVGELLAGKDDFFVVDIILSGTNTRRKIVVILDKNTGILIDECGELSRALGDKIEECGLFENAYTLEVSSPGMDRPLTVKRQYERRIGNKLNFLLADGTTFEAVLQKVSNEGVDVVPVLKKDNKKKKDAAAEPVEELKRLRFEEIKKCNLIVSFK